MCSLRLALQATACMCCCVSSPAPGTPSPTCHARSAEAPTTRLHLTQGLSMPSRCRWPLTGDAAAGQQMRREPQPGCALTCRQRCSRMRVSSMRSHSAFCARTAAPRARSLAARSPPSVSAASSCARRASTSLSRALAFPSSSASAATHETSAKIAASRCLPKQEIVTCKECHLAAARPALKALWEMYAGQEPYMALGMCYSPATPLGRESSPC